MMRWLEGLGAKGLEKISVKRGDKGLGVFALEEVHEGEMVCSIPGCALLSDGSQRSGSNGSSAADLARRLLLEREKGSGSEFEPYISVLPKELPKSHPLMWPHDISVQQLLAGSVHGKAVAEDLLTEGTLGTGTSPGPFQSPHRRTAVAVLLRTHWPSGGWRPASGRTAHPGEGGDFSSLQRQFQRHAVDGLWLFRGVRKPL